MLLSGKSIAVFGAAGLLGSSTVVRLLEEGASVTAIDLNLERTHEKFAALRADVRDSLTQVELDVTNEVSVKSFFQGCERLDGIVNASYPRNKAYGARFENVSLENFNDNVSMHLGSSFLLMREAAEFFRGHAVPLSFVNIASVYGVIAPRFDVYSGTSMTMPVEYAAIKSAIIHLTKYIVRYINDSRFRVNCVSPGGILDRQPESFLEAYKSHTNGTGMLGPEDVVGAMIFLLSDLSKYISGQNILVDDGFSL